jgi:hypothetical protein
VIGGELVETAAVKSAATFATKGMAAARLATAAAAGELQSVARHVGSVVGWTGGDQVRAVVGVHARCRRARSRDNATFVIT